MGDSYNLHKFTSNANYYHFLKVLENKGYDEKVVSIKTLEKNKRLLVLEGSRDLVDV